MRNPQPPAWPRRLLERVLPDDMRGRSIRGDLLEEYGARAREGRAARGWYWWQTLTVVARTVTTRRAPEPPHEYLRKAGWMDSLTLDLKGALRALAKARGFTATAVVTLALGIGAATAVFSVVDTVLLQPLPYADAGRLMWLSEDNPDGSSMSIAWPNFLDWRARQTSFGELAALHRSIFNFVGSGEPERLNGRLVTANFFRVIGLSPALGRAFTEAEDRVGRPRVVLISDSLWRRRFNADARALGATMSLNGDPYTVIGVLPLGFRYNLTTDDDILVPFGQSVTEDSGLLDRGNHNGVSAVARLRPGVDEAAARREMVGIGAALTRAYPKTNSGVIPHVESLKRRLVGNMSPMIVGLAGAVSILLLLAMINVANLLVARGVSRRHELAVRAALGCSRWRLIRQLIVESALLSAAGGAGGIAVAWALTRLFVATAPEDIPRLGGVGLDAAAVAFAWAASTVTALVLGVLPALHSTGRSGQTTVVRASRSDTTPASAHRVHRALMVLEMALAIVLLTGAGLTMRTMGALSAIDPGFDPSQVLAMRFSLDGDRSTPEALAAFERKIVSFADQVTARARAVPGVERAAVTLSLPIEGSQWNSVLMIQGQPLPKRESLPSAAFVPVSSGFFDTMRIPLLRGRDFNGTDTLTSAKTVIVNERFVARYLQNINPLGARIKQGWPEDKDPWREIVGVVRDVRLEGLEEELTAQVYLPFSQSPTAFAAVVVRAQPSVEPGTLLKPVAAAIHDVEPRLPIFAAQTMRDMMRTSTTRRLMTMVIFGAFALVALVLASVGLYGVIAQGVLERTREVGVRLALGASRGQVVGLFLKQGAVTMVIGAVLGIAAAAGLARFVGGLLFHVAPTDPLTFWSAIATLAVVSLAASYLPARRASRISPTVTLRGE